MNRQEEIHFFWFGDLSAVDPVPPERGSLWFGGVRETDEILRQQFGDDVSLAAAGEYNAWAETARGCLSLILLLDQFSRNIFRNTPDAFATDAKALSVCLDGLDSGLDRELAVFERAFFYLPMEHSEEIDMQKKSLTAFSRLIDDATPAQRGMCESYYDYALRHHDVIARFGRFPHRNKIIGRVSTEEEIDFLKEPGSSF